MKENGESKRESEENGAKNNECHLEFFLSRDLTRALLSLLHLIGNSTLLQGNLSIAEIESRGASYCLA